MTNQKETIVDMSSVNTFLFIHRYEGLSAARAIKLHKLVRTFGVIVFKFPDDTFAITNSFFKAMFGEYIKEAASREVFLKQFRFEAPDAIRTEIDTMIDNILLDIDKPKESIKEGLIGFIMRRLTKVK